MAHLPFEEGGCAFFHFALCWTKFERDFSRFPSCYSCLKCGDALQLKNCQGFLDSSK